MFRLPALFLFALLGGTALAGSVSVSGSWSPSLGASDLTAGGTLPRLMSSAGTPITLSAERCGADAAGSAFRVDVSLGQENWSPLLHLSLRRSGDGVAVACPGLSLADSSLSGGAGPVALGPSPVALFSGQGSVQDIALEYQLDLGDNPLLLAPGSYTTSVVFTIVEP